jgi:hypothetical protein
MPNMQIDAGAQKPSARRRGITIFREADAPTLHEAGVMEDHSSTAANAGLAQMFAAGLEDGYVLKCLFRSPDPNGFSLTYAWFKSHYPLPLHTHDSDCLYYVISGEIQMGDAVLGAGDGFMLPKDSVYSYRAGPDGAEVLEFRDSSRFDITIRDGSAQGWERLAAICAANRTLWKSQRPPLRVPKV